VKIAKDRKVIPDPIDDRKFTLVRISMKDSLVCKGPAKTRFSPLEQINFYLLMIHNAMKGKIITQP
jgi:hypothetical protein